MMLGIRDAMWMRRNLTAAAVAALLLLGGAGTVQAQDLNLQRVQNLITAGRFTEARTVLSQWEAQPPANAGVADISLALFLRGMLATDANEAENIYVEVVLSYPSSAVAPQALLRLGQALLTEGEHRRALAYLERLRSDYPGTPERETGMLWLARAQMASGSAATACSTVRDALPATSNANVRSLLEVERDRVCGAGAAAEPQRAVSLGAPPAADPEPPANPPRTAVRAAPQGEPVRTNPAPPAPAQTPPVQTRAPQPAAAETRVDSPARGDYAVQVGAFRELRSAQVIAAQMREKGFDARIVQVDDSPLHRIRFGFFANSAEAAVAGQRIRNAGFVAIIVNDTARELHDAR